MAAQVEEKPPPPPPPQREPRLIVRLGAFLASHYVLFSSACCFAGLVALLLLPALAKNTYISENALIPGSANPVFSSHDVNKANRFIKDIDRMAGKARNGIEVPKFIAQCMEDVGAEVYHHKFLPDAKHFHPLHFFTSTSNALAKQTNDTCTNFGSNTVGIIRAPRGDGKEAIVLVSPYNSEKVEPNEVLSLGLAFSIFSLFSQAAWLAKDIVWLAADSQFGEYSAVSAWLNQYHNPIFLSHSGILGTNMCNANNTQNQPDDITVEGRNFKAFKRAGTMSAALIFKVVEKEGKNDRDSLTMYAEASNGQMPNLDLLNVVHYLAVHRQGFRVNIETFHSLLISARLKFIAEALQALSRFLRILNPEWKLDVTAADYVEGTANLASSIYNQALGVPTGPHGAFRDYQVDAVSLEFSPTFYQRSENANSAFLLRGGRLIEGVVRSVNNLLEKFHQSFFLYFLTAPSKFVSVGVYMIPFALLVMPLPIVAAALSNGSKTKEKSTEDGDPGSKTEEKSTDNVDTDVSKSIGKSAVDGKTDVWEIVCRSWKWLRAAKVLLVIQLWAAVVSLLPYYVSQIPNATPTQSMLTWAVLSICTLVILYLIFGSPYSNVEWELLKASMIASSSIGLGIMSIINFSTAQIGAVLVVPMCLFVRPFKAQFEMNLFVWTMLLTLNIVFVVLGFPPATLLILTGLSKGFGVVNIGDFWAWMEFLWKWNSATYLYLLLVHLPCWLLCIHVLLHPCRQIELKNQVESFD